MVTRLSKSRGNCHINNEKRSVGLRDMRVQFKRAPEVLSSRNEKDTPKAHPCDILATQKKEKMVRVPREERQISYKGRRLSVALDFQKTRGQWRAAFNLLRDSYVHLKLYGLPNIKQDGGNKDTVRQSASF